MNICTKKYKISIKAYTVENFQLGISQDFYCAMPFQGDGQCRGQQRKCWMDNIKHWTSLPMPELLKRASCKKTERGSLQNCPSCPTTTKSVKGLNWTELPFHTETKKWKKKCRIFRQRHLKLNKFTVFVRGVELENVTLPQNDHSDLLFYEFAICEAQTVCLM